MLLTSTNLESSYFFSWLSDTDRDEFWKAKDKLIGQVVEVRADAITQNQIENSILIPIFI